MQRQSVSSSTILSIGYKSETKVLEMEFKNTGVYHYFNVPEQVYRELMAASSHGAYFNENIKNVYGYQYVS